ncbi:hypothetical protein F2Q69_00011303, partial [Brassica cretica]
VERLKMVVLLFQKLNSFKEEEKENSKCCQQLSLKLRISLASSWSIAPAETCTRFVIDSPTEDSPFPPPAVESSSSSPENQPRSSPRRLTRLAKLFHRVLRSKKVQTLEPNRLFVAEPVSARSGSFVGTHEYVAPEVASGGSHGNAVDWWAFGVFLYEIIYGRTPFVAPTNDVILRNIVKRQLNFPTDTPATMFELHARSLISGLLNKDPSKRLGSRRGAAEVKVHPFFKGLNFALIRTLTPPEIPSDVRRPKKAATFSGRSNKPAAFDFF